MKSIVIAATCLLVAGCGAKDGGTSTSQITGTLARSTFRSDPSLLAATNEKGAVVSVEPGAAGDFELLLQKGHTYKLSVLFADGSEPVVFPRTSGKVDQTFRVSTGAVLVNLGLVRHLDSAPSGGFKVKALPVAGAESQADGECENGIDATTGATCIDDQGELACAEGDAPDTADDGADGECKDGVDATTGAACVDPPEADSESSDGECENGVDATTGAACSDPPEAEQDGPMAVAEHNVPDDVGGCDDSGEAEGSD